MTLFPAIPASNPDTALLLAVLGALGICAEFLRPGSILPGVFGSVLLLFGCACLSPIHWIGIPPLLLALALFLLAAKYPARGLLTAAGTILMPLAVLRINPLIHVTAALLTMVPFALLLSFLISAAARARSNKAILIKE